MTDLMVRNNLAFLITHRAVFLLFTTHSYDLKCLKQITLVDKCPAMLDCIDRCFVNNICQV